MKREEKNLLTLNAFDNYFGILKQLCLIGLLKLNRPLNYISRGHHIEYAI
jgi:hypothetical protein